MCFFVQRDVGTTRSGSVMMKIIAKRFSMSVARKSLTFAEFCPIIYIAYVCPPGGQASNKGGSAAKGVHKWSRNKKR